jgi:hypothetical protein
MRRLGLVSSLALVAFTALTAAEASGRAVLYDGISERFRAEPSRVGYLGGPDYPDLLGTSLTISRISWKRWGEREATGRGKGRLCPNMSPCERSRVKLAVSRLARNAEGSDVDIYARLKVRFRQRPAGGSRSVVLCVYGEVCPGKR